MDMDTVRETAQRMPKRYSSAAKAASMAGTRNGLSDRAPVPAVLDHGAG
jgi:hypothetical protein